MYLFLKLREAQLTLQNSVVDPDPDPLVLLVINTHKTLLPSETPSNHFRLRADFKNNQTTKQLTIFIWTNRKVETKIYLLPIGPDIIIYLFGCLIVYKIRSQSLNKRRTTFYNPKAVV